LILNLQDLLLAFVQRVLFLEIMEFALKVIKGAK
jgi:hypothetical protein